jgi:hypothetical protein
VVNGVFNPQGTGGLVRPHSRNILYCVATTTKKDERNVLLAQELDAVSVSVHGQVEAAKFVPGEGVCATLKYDNWWSIDFKDF